MISLPFDYIPGPYDVICAKGKIAYNHSGNRFYRSLIQKALPRYSEATSKFEKTIIVSEIVDKIRSLSYNGGGFVKREKCSDKNNNNNNSNNNNGNEKVNVKDSNGKNSISNSISNSNSNSHNTSSIRYKYYEVGDHIAREKIGQSLRDSLSSQYKSSTKSKRRRREALGTGITNEIETMIQNNRFVCSRINELSSTAATSIMLRYTKEPNYNNTNNNNNKDYSNNNGGNDDERTRTSNISGATVDKDEEQRVIESFTQTNLEILEAFKLDQHLLEKFKAAESVHKVDDFCI